MRFNAIDQNSSRKQLSSIDFWPTEKVSIRLVKLVRWDATAMAEASGDAGKAYDPRLGRLGQPLRVAAIVGLYRRQSMLCRVSSVSKLQLQNTIAPVEDRAGKR